MGEGGREREMGEKKWSEDVQYCTCVSWGCMQDQRAGGRTLNVQLWNETTGSSLEDSLKVVLESEEMNMQKGFCLVPN